MKAVNHYLIIERIKDEPTKVGGLELTDEDTQNRYDKGKVISRGGLAAGVEPDDIIYFDKHAGNSMEFNKKSYQIITIKDVVIIE